MRHIVRLSWYKEKEDINMLLIYELISIVIIKVLKKIYEEKIQQNLILLERD